MSLFIMHRGHLLNQQQLDAIAPVLNDNMQGKIKRGQFEAACDAALEKAGCPVPQAEVPGDEK